MAYYDIYNFQKYFSYRPLSVRANAHSLIPSFCATIKEMTEGLHNNQQLRLSIHAVYFSRKRQRREKEKP